jgi:hypothetical protein
LADHFTKLPVGRDMADATAEVSAGRVQRHERTPMQAGGGEIGDLRGGASGECRFDRAACQRE